MSQMSVKIVPGDCEDSVWTPLSFVSETRERDGMLEGIEKGERNKQRENHELQPERRQEPAAF
jgi:hypothetical protein